jgi:hypothetical protein
VTSLDAPGAPRRTRIVYVDVNVRYHNRTREKCIEALEQSGELVKIGPGFSPPNSAARVLQRVLEQDPLPDVVVTTPHVALASAFSGLSAAGIASVYRRSFTYKFDDAEFSQLVELNRQFRHIRVPRLLILLEADYYNFTAQTIDAFRDVADVILGFAAETWGRKSERQHLMDEAFAARATDCWADFLETSSSTVASFHHLIGDDEFCSVPLSRRPNAWSVLGVRYPARRLAISTLRTHGVSPVVSSPIRKGFSALQRLRILPESGLSIGLIQREFQRRLRGARYSYTCGSGLEMPVRKFFEIPAAGAVLVCRPFKGASDLGFKHAENYLECEPQDIMDAHRFLEQNPDRAQAIADAGRRLIADKHSVGARAAQLELVVAGVLAGRANARWINGEYVLPRPPGD